MLALRVFVRAALAREDVARFFVSRHSPGSMPADTSSSCARAETIDDQLHGLARVVESA